VVIIVRSFRWQRRTDRGDRRACAVDRHGNAATVKVRGSPSGYGILSSEAKGTGCIEATGLTAGSDVRAVTATRTA
jgi:hypothetical protein